MGVNAWQFNRLCFAIKCPIGGGSKQYYIGCRRDDGGGVGIIKQIDSFKVKDFKSNDNSVLQKRRGGGGRLYCGVERGKKTFPGFFFSLCFITA